MNGEDMVLAAGAAQEHGARVAAGLLETPDVLVKIAGLLEIEDGELDAAQPDHPRLVHSSLPKREGEQPVAGTYSFI